MKRLKGVIQFFEVAVLALSAVGMLGCGGRSTSATIAATSIAVADAWNGRVVIYNAPFRTNESASVTLDQAYPSDPPSLTSQLNPWGLTKDQDGNLYVVDTSNCRVLQFQPPFTADMSATVVIGATDITEFSCNYWGPATPSTMINPMSATIDGHGNLWVADSANSRVLEFVPPFSNGMSATLAIGQGSTGAAASCDRVSPATPSTLCEPNDVAFDPNGNLWVADRVYSRVLEFVPPFSTGMAASLELGQPAETAFTSFSPNNGGISATSLNFPSALKFDPNGNLWVSDQDNNRVLEFIPPFSNGMAAAQVIGQPDFTHNDASDNEGGGHPTASSLSSPVGLEFDSSGSLLVADMGNNRVLIYSPPLRNGMSASIALGQPNLTSGRQNQGGGPPDGCGPSAAPNGLCFPARVVVF